ncbi:MAG: LysM peptidoglycan-binding domain-containing protein [Phycisphaerae bacterium]
MTKETKIGLLVGLAFIILFAVILSEKGARRGVDSTMIADAGHARQPAGPDATPLRHDGRVAVEEQLAPIIEAPGGATAPIHESPIKDDKLTQAVPSDGTALPPLPAWLLDKLNYSAAQAGEGDEKVPVADAATAGTPINPAPILVDAAPDKVSEHTPTEATTISVANATTSTVKDPIPDKALGNTPAIARSAPRKPRTIKTIHVVKPGECLGKVAALYYGRSTAARARAIFEANRDILTDINSVRANDALKIPELDDTGSAFEPAPQFAAATITPSRTSEKDGEVRIPRSIGQEIRRRSGRTGSRHAMNAAARKKATRAAMSPSSRARRFRWYEVRSGDSLSAIARRELGNEKRFNELYRLNRDRLDDKHRLKPGIRLRLPIVADSTALSASAADMFSGRE